MAEIVQIIIIVLGTLVGFTIAGVVGFGGGIVVLPILV
ncbi:MAG: sulfite exporter TauE/SafE family protein, partial [SAR202 cluster bacterium]|nr:sulfite exporter TauE/SafE family protein [SAR202 cluster bacterium]